LAGRFLAEYAGRNRPDVAGFSAPALQALAGYGWPGNVRELRNVVERAVALCPGPQVRLVDLPEPVRGPREGLHSVTIVPSAATARPTLQASKEAAEVGRILEALGKHRNNKLRAARELGISRQGLYKKLDKYGLSTTA
jgi:DNA-binding NtrC family response regulator